MYTSIVVGTDGSPDAARAVQVAAEMAAARPETKVHVVTAAHPLTAAELRAITADLPEEFHPLVHSHMHVDETLAKARTVLSAAGVDAVYHDADGDPAGAILDLIDDRSADLVIVGSRGQGATGRMLHGSVSTKVLHHAPCSVLVAKGEV